MQAMAASIMAERIDSASYGDHESCTRSSLNSSKPPPGLMSPLPIRARRTSSIRGGRMSVSYGAGVGPRDQNAWSTGHISDLEEEIRILKLRVRELEGKNQALTTRIEAMRTSSSQTSLATESKFSLHLKTSQRIYTFGTASGGTRKIKGKMPAIQQRLVNSRQAAESRRSPTKDTAQNKGKKNIEEGRTGGVEKSTSHPKREGSKFKFTEVVRMALKQHAVQKTEMSLEDRAKRLKEMKAKFEESSKMANGTAEEKMLANSLDSTSDPELSDKERSTLEAFLAENILFADISVENMKLALSMIVRVSVGENETIMKTGERGTLFYIVHSGQITCLIDGKGEETGGTQIHIGPGEGLGELALMCGQARMMTVMTSEPTELLALDRATFDKIVTKNERLRNIHKKHYNLLSNCTVLTHHVANQRLQGLSEAQLNRKMQEMKAASSGLSNPYSRVQLLGSEETRTLRTSTPGNRRRLKSKSRPPSPGSKSNTAWRKTKLGDELTTSPQ